MHEGGISIWYFIGICLDVIGALIFGTGLYHLASPPPIEHRVVLYDLHADVWWGAVLFIVGVIYTVKFRPSKTAGTAAHD